MNRPKIRFKGYTDDWEQRKLGEIFNFQYGEFNNNPDNGGEYPIYGANGVIGGYTKYNAESSSIIGHMGAYAGYVVWAEGKHFVTYNGTIAKPSDNFLDCKFGYYLLSNKQIYKICAGSGQPFVSYADLNGIDVVVPKEKLEQEQVAKYFTKIDHLITLHQRKCEQTKKLKKFMLQKMFPQNGSSFPEIRFSGFTDAWEQRKLEQIVDVRSGRDYKHLSEGDIPVYGTGGYMLSVDEALSYDEDAIGIGRKETIDNPYILKAPFWTVDTLFYAVPREQYDLNFVYDIFQNINWKQKDESTGVPSLSKTTINNVETLVPGYVEQQRIGTYFSKIDSLITLHQRKCDELQNIKKFMLQNMFV